MSMVHNKPNTKENSVNTEDVGNDLTNIESLKSMESYNVPTLHKMAKILNIPIRFKDDNGSRPYKKNELYNKIKEYIEKNKKSN
ncbi:MAG: hypothetical protein Edafosvirus42_3 [Edafosvirus sp.]|uniref:Uncharacterized protein n=1 Tax=Edafosvirus sp. TaxID=2487765 RepID=A0A3G4ZX05_9VIRU|nr:MAG: hypothetical protein Edafosvirus42_3 [Edafosvirus sp.]